mmetsp:Transcript_3758/g.5469  ORF Transcript_3758/g.5469 Transcript_3758/m.5469 type:complete len:103 (-) Transcript_3758:103-411(-)
MMLAIHHLSYESVDMLPAPTELSRLYQRQYLLRTDCFILFAYHPHPVTPSINRCNHFVCVGEDEANIVLSLAANSVPSSSSVMAVYAFMYWVEVFLAVSKST